MGPTVRRSDGQYERHHLPTNQGLLRRTPPLSPILHPVTTRLGRLRRVSDVRVQGSEMYPSPIPRLDGVSVRSSRRKSPAEGPTAAELLRHTLPGVPPWELQQGRLVRVCSRRVRVLASPDSVPDSALQRRP
uniref:Uncharacterized protein n=1 Tax=Opuntia streptacantha TaxID=393608 RepID=A0A7C8YM07_OPUST